MLMEFPHSRDLEPLGAQDTKSPQGGELELSCQKNPRPLKDEMLHEIVDWGGEGNLLTKEDNMKIYCVSFSSY